MQLKLLTHAHKFYEAGVLIFNCSYLTIVVFQLIIMLHCQTRVT